MLGHRYFGAELQLDVTVGPQVGFCVGSQLWDVVQSSFDVEPQQFVGLRLGLGLFGVLLHGAGGPC